MNIFCLIFLVITILLIMLFWKRSIVYVVESTLSLILSFFLTIYFFDSIITFLDLNGMRENVYSPSIIFILLITVCWGLILTFFVIFINFGEIIQAIRAKYYSIILGLLFGYIIAVTGCITLHPFLRNEKLSEKLNQCFLCQSIESNFLINDMTKSIGHITSDVFTPVTPTDAFLLEEEYREFNNSDIFIQDLYKKINFERRLKGLEELELDENLNALAESYAREINSNHLLSHFDQEMHDAKERAQLQKIKFDYIGENLAVASTTKLAHNAFLQSKTHQDNILSPVFKKVGIAVFRSSKGNLLIVQQFTN